MFNMMNQNLLQSNLLGVFVTPFQVKSKLLLEEINKMWNDLKLPSEEKFGIEFCDNYWSIDPYTKNINSNEWNQLHLNPSPLFQFIQTIMKSKEEAKVSFHIINPEKTIQHEVTWKITSNTFSLIQDEYSTYCEFNDDFDDDEIEFNDDFDDDEIEFNDDFDENDSEEINDEMDFNNFVDNWRNGNKSISDDDL